MVSNDLPRIGFMINRNGLQRSLRRNCPALNVVHRSPTNEVEFLCNLIIPRRLISSGLPFVSKVSSICNLLTYLSIKINSMKRIKSSITVAQCILYLIGRF